MQDLISSYMDAIQMLEQRLDDLSSHLSFTCGCKNDIFLRCQVLEDEINDLYFAVNLMKK